MSFLGLLPQVTALAALLSLGVAAQRSAYRPVAALLATAAASNIIRPRLVAAFVLPAQDALRAAGLDPLVEPLHGVALAALHVDHALFLLWPFGIAALSVRVFLGRCPWSVLLAWLGAVVVLVLGYEHLRGAAAQRVYLPCELGALALSLGSVVTWTWRRRSPWPEHAAALLIVLLECVAAMTYSGSLIALWPMARVAYVALYCVLVVGQGGAVCWLGSRSSV